MPLPDGDVALIHLVIHIANVFPVLAIIVLGSVGGFTVVFGEDGVPDRGSVVVDVDSK